MAGSKELSPGMVTSPNFLLRKNSRLIRFLNQRHSLIFRFFAASIYFVISFFVSRKLSLSSNIYRDLINGDLKGSSRRLVWYITTAFPKIKIADDSMFYFPVFGDKQISLDQADFINRTSRVNSKEHVLADNLILQATAITAAIGTDVNQNIEDLVGCFYRMADDFLGCLPRPVSVPPIGPETSNISTPTQDDDKNSFIEPGMKCLADFAQLCPSSEIQWFVTGGTCLGLARSSSLLPHDIDVDVGVFYEENIEKSIIEKAEKSEQFSSIKLDYTYDIKQSDSGWACNRYPAFLKLIHKNGVNIDVFFHYRIDNKIVHGSSCVGWINDNFTLSLGHIGEISVFHPDPLDFYLTEHYGDWRIVKKDFSCTTDTTNIFIGKSFIGIAMMLKRLSPEVSNKFPDSSSLITTLCDTGLINEHDGSFLIQRNFFKE